MRFAPHPALIILILFVASCRKDDPAPEPPPPQPQCAEIIAPANNGFVANTSSVTFRWTTASANSVYDIYFGKTPATAVPIAQNLKAGNFTYTIPSATHEKYYWWIVTKTPGIADCNSAEGSFSKISISAPAPLDFWVVGYHPEYRDPGAIPDVKFRMTNVVIYAFFAVNSSGTLTLGNEARLLEVVRKSKANGAKAFMGINDGTGDGTTNFTRMASTPAGRTKFVADVMNKVRKYNLDGVDMDWEYPRVTNGTDQTFTQLMKELADSLHRDAKYYLSAAITAGKYAGSVREAISNELFPVVDFFGIMAYDDFSTTMPYQHHSDYELARVCLDYWINTRKMPKEKAVLGMPMYGRPSGISMSGNVLTYQEILRQGGNPAADSASVSSANVTNYTIYYNGTTTVKKKAELAKNTAGGLMFWEKGQDAHDDYSLLKAACDAIGRRYF